jgi:hypothetical protein
VVDVIIREFLGNWGQTVLDTYLAYSLYINSILFVYVILVILSRRNYQVTLTRLLEILETQYQTQLRKKDRRQIRDALKAKPIPWEQALNASKYPFLTPPRGIGMRVKSVRTIQKLIPLETLATLLEQHQKEHKPTS